MPTKEQTDDTWDFPHEFINMMIGLVMLAMAFLVFQLIVGGNFLGAVMR